MSLFLIIHGYEGHLMYVCQPLSGGGGILQNGLFYTRENVCIVEV